MPQYKLRLVPGDRVRNIRAHSSRRGQIGTVAEVPDDRQRWMVIYNNGIRETYLKSLAHVSLERVYNECHCQQKVLNLDLSKLEERVLAGYAAGDFVVVGAVHDEIHLAPKRRVLKKVRRNVISGKTQDDMVREMGNARGVQQFNTRCLGRSTGQALRIIGDAMCNPTTEIRIKDIDHAVSQGIGQRMAVNEHFRQLVKSLIGNMKGFTFTDTHIVFHPIVTEETYVETH